MIDGYNERLVQPVDVPDYLQNLYWWAYLHPRSMKFFEQQWVINGILWGNYARLRDATLEEMGEAISGRTLQVACVYGNLTPMLAQRHRPDARLDVVDAVPIQLENLSRKLSGGNIFLDCQDASRLRFKEAVFDQVLLFFLLHELPVDVRKRAIGEAFRVLKPGGKMIFMDYHRPKWRHPHRYLMPLIFKMLEPFAMDLWRTEIAEWVPQGVQLHSIEKTTYFGALYQKVVMRK